MAESIINAVDLVWLFEMGVNGGDKFEGMSVCGVGENRLTGKRISIFLPQKSRAGAPFFHIVSNYWRNSQRQERIF